MDYKGLKTGGWVANLRKKEKKNGLVGAKNRVQGRPTLGKERNLIDL